MTRRQRIAAVLVTMLLAAHAAGAEVVRIEITRRDDAITHQRIIGRVHFAVDPANAANRAIADLDRAPRNARGQVEFVGDLLMFVPKPGTPTRHTVFLEVPNRGRDQALAVLSGAQQTDLSPASWVLGDRFLLEQGFAVAWLGWQFDVRPSSGLTFDAPVAPVRGVVRDSYIEPFDGRRTTTYPVTYCATLPQSRARLTFRRAIEDPPQDVPPEAWSFAGDGCSVRYAQGFEVGLYEAIYEADGSPVAGLGLAAIRDFASYLRYADDGGSLLNDRSDDRRVIGYGYSQSGRFLREFVRDGFNADERGRAAFDGLMIASAGAGGGSFNHRFAVPGEAGNSVLSILRPVDIPPFTDDGLLAKARQTRTTPKIIYTFSSTEYWARAGSLVHTDPGTGMDVPLADTSRLYFLGGTPHSGGALPPRTTGGARRFDHPANFAQQRWVARALLVDLDQWVHAGTEPPQSRYPLLSRRELVPLEALRPPSVPSLGWPAYMPRVWQMDFGADYQRTRVITNEPPRLGAALPILVPQVDADGNDVGGVRLPEVAVPLGTYTGWNVEFPSLKGLRYLAGLIGSFEPFARTRAVREAMHDSRPSIEERYASRDAYLNRVKAAADDLVRSRLMLAADVPSVVARAQQMWEAIVNRE